MAGVVPGGDGGVGHEDGRVGGHGRGEDGGDSLGDPAGPSAHAGDLGRGGGCHRRAEGGEEPRPHAHGGRHLGHPEHVQEPGRASEVGHQEDAAHADRGRRRQQAPAGEAGVAREPSAGGEERRPGCDPTGEEVGRDVPLPHRPLEDGPPVVRPHRRGSGHRRAAAAAEEGGGDAHGQGGGGGGRRAPHPGEVAGGDHRVGGQAVDLGVVEEEEEGAHAADAVGRVGAVEAGLGHARRLQRVDPSRGPGPQLVQRPELDRLGRAGGGARRLQPAPQPVVAHGAFPGPPVPLALVDHPERAGGDAVAAAVADVLLHHHGAELGAHQRPGGAHLQAGGRRAVLAHVGAHQPPESPVASRPPLASAR